MKDFFELREKSVSQQQQKLMGLALAYKRGEVADDEVSDEVKKIANSMSTKDLEDFAKTKHKGLPKQVDEYGGPPISRKDYLKQKPMQESSLKEWSTLKNQLDEKVSRREFAKLQGTFKDSISKNVIEFDENGMGFVVEDKRGNVHEFEYKNMNVLNENVEDRMPASPDEKRMAMKQTEFIQYVGREVAEHLAANKEFPEWMQNKLSALHQKAKDMHSTLGAHGETFESVELDESVKKVDNLSQLPKGVEKPLVSMDKVRKEVKMRGMKITHISHNKSGKVIGVSAKASNGTVFTYVNNKGVKESVELDESKQKLFMFDNKKDAQAKAKEIRGKMVELGPKNFAAMTKDLTVVKEGDELEENARADARRAMKNDPDMKQRFSKNVSADDDDRKAADKNIIVQLRRITDLPRGGEVEFKNGKTMKVSQKDAKKLIKGFDGLRKGPDKERFQRMAGKDPSGLKRVMSLVK